MSRSPIFIGGLMKSGTTLLRVLIGRHPNLYSGMETHWFSDNFRTNWLDSSSKGQQLFRQLYGVSDDEFERIKQSSTSGVDFFTRLMDFCTQQSGKMRWVEKSPDNIIFRKDIYNNWPDSRLIHVVRDYRDVYASWKRKGKYNIEQFISKVNTIAQSNTALLGTHSEFYLEVDYELLVTDTTSALKAILSHIGEDWVDGLESYEGDSSDFNRLYQATGQKSSTLESIARPVFTTSIGQWKNILEIEEVRRIEGELGDLMKIWKWI